MSYIFLLGILATVLAIFGYVAMKQKTAEGAKEISWKKCIFSGVIIYILSIFLGAFSTSIVQNAFRFHSISSYLEDVLSQTFIMFFYALVLTFFLVLPVMIIGLKYLSKTGLNNGQKQAWYAFISFFLVIIINMIMSGFFTNPGFILFLAGYSFFGVMTPWAFVSVRKVFAA